MLPMELTMSSQSHLALSGTRGLQNERLQIHWEPSAAQNRGGHIYSPRPHLVGQFSALLSDAPLPSPGIHYSEILGSTALRTPSVESPSAPFSSFYGPIGKERRGQYPPTRDIPIGSSNHLLLPNLDEKSGEMVLKCKHGNESVDKHLYPSRAASPGLTAVCKRGNDRAGLPQDQATSIHESVGQAFAGPVQLPLFQSTIDETLSRLGMLSLVDTTTPSRLSRHPGTRYRRAPRHVNVERPPHRSSFSDVPLFNCVGHLLDTLDGTFRTQHQICDQVLELGILYGLSKAIPIIIECVLELGVIRGFPRNAYIAGFCRFFLPKASKASVGPDSLEPTDHYHGIIRSAFVTAFNKWWRLVSARHSFLIQLFRSDPVFIRLPKPTQ